MFRRQLLRGSAAGLIASALAAPALILPRPARAESAEREPVDVELILAVDVSRSVDPDEQELQMRGYAAAFRDPKLAEGIARGSIGSIACMMFTWSDWHIQEIMVPWTRIDGAATAEGFAKAVDAAPRRTWLYTSISGAIDFSMKQFESSGYEGMRRVIDISGDGVNNSGRPLADSRAEALAKGVVINGLPVLDRVPPPPQFAAMHPPLDEYYRDEVIGGPGAFVMVAEGFESFEEAARRKIIREIASNDGPSMERAFG